MKNPHRQVKLRSDGVEMTCWLPASSLLRVGHSIKLKDHDDPNRWWRIMHVGERIVEKSKLHTEWHNNI